MKKSLLQGKDFVFTSESVTEGHPDKVCDQISDGVLDAVLKQDPFGRVACETFVTMGLVIVGGEITTKAVFDVHEITRNVINNIGYDDVKYGFDYKTCAILNAIHTQSPDIAQGVDSGRCRRPGAYDRFCLQGDAGTDASSDNACPSALIAPCRSKKEKYIGLSWPGWKIPGYG